MTKNIRVRRQLIASRCWYADGFLMLSICHGLAVRPIVLNKTVLWNDYKHLIQIISPGPQGSTPDRVHLQARWDQKARVDLFHASGSQDSQPREVMGANIANRFIKAEYCIEPFRCGRRAVLDRTPNCNNLIFQGNGISNLLPQYERILAFRVT